MEGYKEKVAALLDEGVHCNNSPLFVLRGQVWQQVVRPLVIDELLSYWKVLAMQGRTLFEAARYVSGKNVFNMRIFAELKVIPSL